jgi:EAL and modified HD-GYP domain-containing signal transduction protein
MSLLSRLFGRRPEPTPPPPPPAPPRTDQLTLTGAGLEGADTGAPATVTITFGDKTFTATATRRGTDLDFALGDIHEAVAPPAASVPPPAASVPPPTPPPAPEVAAPDETADVVETPEVVVPVDEVVPPADEEVSVEDALTAAPAAPLPDERDEVAVVRKPVTDGEGSVVGYELVAATKGVRGTAGLLLDAFGDIGLERLAGRHPAWVRVSPEFLLTIGTPPVRPDRVVLQIVAEEVSDEVLAALRRLQFSGYTLALEGIDERLLTVCGLLKLSVAGRTDEELAELIADPLANGVKLVATDVSTPEEQQRCRDLGFTAFQGDFFAKPDLTRQRRVGTGGETSLRALAAVTAPDASFEDLEAAITSDVGLSLKLLRYVNSAFFALPRTVESVREALTLLGTATVRRWATVVALAAASDAPEELVELALQRARMCEVLGGSQDLDGADAAFTVGLFSVADALLDAPMDDVLETLPFSEEIRGALLRREGPKGELLNAVVAYERGEFPADDGSLQGAYGEAVEWAGGAVAGTAP